LFPAVEHFAPKNKKPADAWRAGGLMSANFDALLNPPRAQPGGVMMMAVMLRGASHREQQYTRDSSLRQEMW